jgi:hypothetical protein
MYCNPHGPLLPHFIQKLLWSGATGTIVAPPMDRQSMAPSAYQDGFRRTCRRAPSKLVPTPASGATRYNRQSSLGRCYAPISLMAWLYLRRGAVSATFAPFTGIHREPRVWPTNQAQVHGNRHSQHQPVDQDDETVHYHDSRLGRTQREGPSPTLRRIGTHRSKQLTALLSAGTSIVVRSTDSRHSLLHRHTWHDTSRG